MNTTFNFLAAPASGAGIFGIGWKAGAGLAADAGVSPVVKLEQRNPVLLRVATDILCRPLRKRAELADGAACGQREVFDELECGPALGLLATQPGKPQRILLKSGEEGRNLAQAATAAGNLGRGCE